VTGLSDRAVERLRAVANWPEFASERYVVTEEIGRGGMGSVYGATDLELGRDVAIKVSNTLTGAEPGERLGSEARVLAALEHPGIVPVHDVGRLSDGRTFYVMKRVEGLTLTERMKEPLDLGERLRIFERICEAVAFAHAHRILHRDLKPDNVMVGRYGEVMVMDWGIAKALATTGDRGGNDAPLVRADRLASNTAAGTVVGTHGFMAPEQARGGGHALDERADIYALGAILLALLSNRGAAAAPSEPPRGRLAALTAIPRPLRSICGRALEENPEDRYPSAAALRDDIARFRSGQSVRAHRENALERTARLARVYRTPLLLILAYMIMRALVAFATRG
jgi:serine/threonine protein kinase